jgi:hypothetical protein
VFVLLIYTIGMASLSAPGSDGAGNSKDGKSAGPLAITPEVFAARLHDDGVHGGEVGIVVRATMTAMLGELSTLTALSYAGDATSGDFLGFATRIEELFGSSGTMLLSQIVAGVETALPRPPAP